MSLRASTSVSLESAHTQACIFIALVDSTANMWTHVGLLALWFNTGRRRRSPQRARAACNAQGRTCNTQGRTCRATATRWNTVCTHKEPCGVHTRDTKNPGRVRTGARQKQVHDRNTRRVHTMKRACECKCAADGPPTPSGVRTQANSLQESCLGTGATARVRVLCQSHPSQRHQPILN